VAIRPRDNGKEKGTGALTTTLFISGRMPDPAPWLARALLDARRAAPIASRLNVTPLYPIKFGMGTRGGGREANNATASASTDAGGLTLPAVAARAPASALRRLFAAAAPETRRFLRQSSTGAKASIESAIALAMQLAHICSTGVFDDEEDGHQARGAAAAATPSLALAMARDVAYGVFFAATDSLSHHAGGAAFGQSAVIA
jgi:hypothetical protein